MAKHTITNVNYRLESDLIENRRCVAVNFLFDGKNTKREIYFSKEEKINYLKAAKYIIEDEIHNGKLVIYAKKYHKKPIFTSKLGIITTVVTVFALGVGGFFIWRSLTPAPLINPRKGDVVDAEVGAVDKDGAKHRVTVSNTVAIVGDPYKTDIILEEENFSRLALPEKLDKVTSNGEEVSSDSYTYETIDKTKAQLTIPAESVKGVVRINLTLCDYDVTVKMKVGDINRCSISYEGKPLSKGDTYKNFPTEKVKFKVGDIDFGYCVDNQCFHLTYEDGTEAKHSYDESTKTLSVEAYHDFTFSVSAAVPEGSVLLTASYNTDCEGIYYEKDHLIKNGESLPVKIRNKKIEPIGINVDDSVSSLIPFEFTCSLVGAKIEMIQPITPSDFDYEISINLESCAKITNFTLDIHPGIYNPLKVGITKGEYCSAILYNGVEVSYASPNEVVPVMSDDGLSVSFEAITTGSILKENDIVCIYTTKVEHVINNVYKITISNISDSAFSMHVEPGQPLDAVQVSLISNKRCTVAYKGVPVPSGSSVMATPILAEEDNVKKIVFGFSLKDGAEFNEEHVWISNNSVLSSIADIEVDLENKQIIISIPSDQDFSYFSLEVKPGNPNLTLTYNPSHCTVYYLDENEEEVLVPTDTPFEFVPVVSSNPDIGRILKFHVVVDENYLVNGFRSDSSWNNNDEILRVPGTDNKLFIMRYDRGLNPTFSDVSFNVHSEHDQHPDIHVYFNKAVKSVTYGDKIITKSGDAFENTKILGNTFEFYVQTDNVRITQNDTIKQVTLSGDPAAEYILSWAKIKLDQVSGGTEPYLYKLSLTMSNSYDWSMFYFNVNIFPEEDTTVNTVKGGDTDTYTLKYGEEEIEAGEGKQLPFKKGIYEYDFIVDADDDYDIDNYEVNVTTKSEPGVSVVLESSTLEGDNLKVKFDGHESILNQNDIVSLNINVNTREKTRATAIFTFGESYSVHDIEGNEITSGADISITEPTFNFYVNTTEELNSEYILLNNAPGVSKTVKAYEGEKDYNYVVTLSNITSLVGEFGVTITRPAMIALDDATDGWFVDYMSGGIELGKSYSINESIGDNYITIAFEPDGWYADEDNVSIELVASQSDPGLSITTEFIEKEYQYVIYVIHLNGTIHLGSMITLHIEQRT